MTIWHNKWEDVLEKEGFVGKPSGRLEECCRSSTVTVLEGSSKKQKRLEAKD
jgi:hypothetical protein